MPGSGRLHHKGRLRDLRLTGAGPLALTRAGGGDGQPRGAQGGKSARDGGGQGLRGIVPAAVLALAFSPIEEAFSKVKGLLRKGAARTREALVDAIGRALDAVTARDARGWFAHCGYPLGAQPS